MTYLINDIFYTLQGEGHWTGRAAVFVRFAKCNLWTGREADRANAVCTFCDTDFTKGTRYTLDQLLEEVDIHLFASGEPMVVLTGGEPLLQVDTDLLDGLRRYGFYIAVETNGTQPVPEGIDWVCVSPKTRELKATRADELKLVYPQAIQPKHVDEFDATHFWLSPMDGPDLAQNTEQAIAYCLNNPQWRFNLQTHKTIGVK
jgi:7-carboxy-7-deazaguanine synthase